MTVGSAGGAPAVIISGDRRSAHQHQRFQFFRTGTTKKLVWLPRDARGGGYRHGDGIQKITLGNEAFSLEQYIPFYLAVPLLSSIRNFHCHFYARASDAVMKRNTLEQVSPA
jgi:hypothetical protein